MVNDLEGDSMSSELPIFYRLFYITHLHGSARVLYKDDDQSQWENAKFDPRHP